MKRRTFLVTLGASQVLHGLMARAQVPSVPVVGFLNSASLATYSFNASAFREGLRQAGFSKARTSLSSIAGQTTITAVSLHSQPIWRVATSQSSRPPATLHRL